jgi:hypothetical protein
MTLAVNKIQIVRKNDNTICIRIINLPGWRTLGCNCLENCKVKYSTSPIDETSNNNISYGGNRYWIKIAN